MKKKEPKTTTKNTQGNPKAAGIVMVFLAIFFVALAVMYIVVHIDLLQGNAKDVNEILESGQNLNNYEGEYVNVDVDICFGAYAEKKDTINHIITIGKERYYVICLNDSSLVSLLIKGNKNYDNLDEIVDETNDLIDGKISSVTSSITYTGKIEEMDSDVRSAFDDALDYMGVTSDITVYYLNIDAKSTPVSVVTMSIVFLLLAIGSGFVASVGFKNAKLTCLSSESVEEGINTGRECR